MPLSARIGVDFSEFRRAVELAKVDLDKLGLSSKNVSKDLTSMVASFSGAKVIRDAELMTAAIRELGGVTKLTTQEKERLTRVLDQAIAKYTALGQTAPPAMRNLADAARQAGVQHESLAASIGKTALGYVAGFATFATAQRLIGGTVDFLGESVTAYAEAEAAQKRLSVAMMAQGTAIPATIAHFESLQKTLAQTTIYDDDLIAEMQALMVQVGDVMPSEMGKALTAATDLAAGLGIDLRDATMMVAKASEGQVTALRKLGIETTDASGKTLDFAELLDRIGDKFGGQGAAAVKTYQGALAGLKKEWGELKEAIGKAIAEDPFLKGGIQGVTGALSGLRSLIKTQGIGGILRMGLGGTAASALRGMGQAAAAAELEAWARPPNLPGLWQEFGPQPREELAGPEPRRPLTPEQLASRRKAEEQLRTWMAGHTGFEGALVGRPPDYYEWLSTQGMAAAAPAAWWQATVPTGAMRGLAGMKTPALPTGWSTRGVSITDASKSGLWGSLKSTAQSDQLKAMALGYGVNLLQGWAGADPTSKGKGAIGGAASGAMAGAAFGPWGAAAGAVIGGVSGWLGAQSAQRKLGKDADASIAKLQEQILGTFGSLDKVRAAGKALGVDLAGAWGDKNVKGLEHFKQLAEEFNKKLQEQHEILGRISERGGLVGKTTIQALGGTEEGRAALEQFVGQQTTRGVGGLQQYVGAMATAGTPISAGAAVGIGGAAAALFGELQTQGTPLLEILNQMGPTVESLRAQFAATGTSGGAAFEAIASIVTSAIDPAVRSVLEGSSGLDTVLQSLHNTGLLNQETFAGLTTAVGESYAQLTALGQGGSAAMQLLQPNLQTIWQLQQDFGYQVDEATQALLDEASASGLVGEKFKPAADRMADSLERLLEKFDLLLGAIGGDQGLIGEIGRIPRDITIGVRYDYEDYVPPVEGESPTGHRGGLAAILAGHPVIAHRGLALDEIPAILQTGEGVLSRAGMRALGLSTLRSLNAGISTRHAGAVAAPDLGNAATLRELRQIRSELASLPIILSRTMRDTWLLSGGGH